MIYCKYLQGFLGDHDDSEADVSVIALVRIVYFSCELSAPSLNEHIFSIFLRHLLPHQLQVVTMMTYVMTPIQKLNQRVLVTTAQHQMGKQKEQMDFMMKFTLMLSKMLTAYVG